MMELQTLKIIPAMGLPGITQLVMSLEKTLRDDSWRVIDDRDDEPEPE